MTPAEITLFIAKSLSISVGNENLKEIKKVLKSQKIDWDLLVKISTSQLVLPALYCNYKRKNLLQFLPDDLVTYMQEITSLNRERNLQIIEQLNHLNILLKQSGVTPVFLKGASNLLQGLYEDPAERMVGDIDFIVSEDKFEQSVEILLKNDYKPLDNQIILRPGHRHHSRLIKKDKIAAVEIHKEIVIEKFAKEFNYEFIKDNINQNNGFSALSFDDQKALSIFSNQINDFGFDYKSVSLKNAYDFLLLSNKEPGVDFAHRNDKLSTPIMFFMASVNYMFGDIGINFHHNRKVKKNLKLFKSLLHNPFKRKYYSKMITIKLFLADWLKLISKSFIDKEYRTWLVKRISDKRWQQEKLVQLKFKK